MTIRPRSDSVLACIFSRLEIASWPSELAMAKAGPSLEQTSVTGHQWNTRDVY